MLAQVPGLTPVPPFALASISPAALGVVSALLEKSAPLAVSVWEPGPARARSPLLKAHNQAFLDLCDAPRFLEGRFSAVLMTAPIFPFAETAVQVGRAQERMWRILEGLQLGEITQGRCTYLHVSRVGRVKRVVLELVAVHSGDRLEEFVAAEAELWGQDLVDPDESIATVPLRRHSSAPPAAAALTDSPQSWTFSEDTEGDTKPKRRDSDSKRSSDDSPQFACRNCGTTNTVQKRYPDRCFAQ